jgi:hypothetical protein
VDRTLVAAGWQPEIDERSDQQRAAKERTKAAGRASWSVPVEVEHDAIAPIAGPRALS